jgi:hypothetical protein
MTSLLQRFLVNKRAPLENYEGVDAMCQDIAQMVGSCPVCKLSLASHTWAKLAEAGTEADYHRALRLCSERLWGELAQIHSFDGTRNAVLVMAICCPTDGGVVFPYVDYQELYAASERGEIVTFDVAQWEQVASLPNLQWHEFYLGDIAEE